MHNQNIGPSTTNYELLLSSGWARRVTENGTTSQVKVSFGVSVALNFYKIDGQITSIGGAAPSGLLDLLLSVQALNIERSLPGYFQALLL